ncbi:hypothetical protein M2324_003603 [Rhodovulum sulfidophilum]|uniref:hypothetical protein n=1 Tax=Rhodovulum sulfidophilum TaxID=35806 RepID=UPI0005AA6E79|nr:hypothetical protein [Rhodovulum sulfidophilum]ANB33278.1 hypothetical protein A6W98_03815 [Rhodovulum sulfidophilum DSM 1374]ANB37126.1 hypothetical protein A6024_03800 [Rhodovulum sulfidophilum]MCW2305184.1 hypothetical protein [Rhodovulum sulfidophilum]
MTYVDMGVSPRGPLVSGRAFDRINEFFGLLGQRGGAEQIEAQESLASSHLSLLEQRLRYVQHKISEISMHLPKGFTAGLNRQFANLMDEDAWENEDELVSPNALATFILVLLSTKTSRRPGIGTNGRGSITASWTEGDNRLTIECLPTKRVSLVLSRGCDNGEIERAAFDPMRPERVSDVLAPFHPEVWFDG